MTDETRKDSPDEMVTFFKDMTKRFREFDGKPHNRGDKWRKTNPLDLIGALLKNVKQGVATGKPVHWVDAANFCMMMANLESEQRARLTQGPGFIAVEAGREEHRVVHEFAVNRRLPETEADYNLLMTFMKRLDTATSPVAPSTEE